MISKLLVILKKNGEKYEGIFLNLCPPASILYFWSKSSSSREDVVFKHDWSLFNQENFALDFQEIDWDSAFD